MTNDAGVHGELTINNLSLQNLPTSAPLKGDFTYQLIENLKLSGKSLSRSLWTGAVMKNCVFTNIDFSRSDFAGTKFIDCTFDGCNLEPNELRSCLLQNCNFDKCNLAGLHSISSQFRDCKFVSCNLQRATLRECFLLKCEFVDSQFPRSSITINRFEKCKFTNQTFGDATVLFVFFEDCFFQSCSMNAETVGFTFGLTSKNIEGLDLIYLGETQEKPIDVDVISVLISSYQSRRWYLGTCLLQVNFSKVPKTVALSNYINSIASDAKKNGRIDLDELTFFIMVLEQLMKDEELPFFSIWQAMQSINAAIHDVEIMTPGFANFSPALTSISAKLREIFETRLIEFSETEADNELFDGTIRLKITLAERPARTLESVIPNEIHEILNTSPNDFELVNTLEGSWIEYWDVGLAAFGAIHLALASVDTTWERLASLKKKADASVRALRRVKAKDNATNTSDTSSSTLPAVPKRKFDLNTLATVIEQAAFERTNLSKLDKKSLKRIDKAVKRLSALNNDDLEYLLEYASPNLEEIERV